MSLLRNGKLMNQLGSSLPSELNSDWDSYSAKRPKCCSFKCWLTAWNYGILILIWFGSGANIVFSVLGRMRLSPLSPFSYTEIDPIVAVIGLEILTFLIAVVAFSSLIRQKVAILYLVCILMGLLFVAHSAISIITYVYIETGTGNLYGTVKQSILTYTPSVKVEQYASTAHQPQLHGIDYAQKMFGCCGLMSYTDWSSNEYYACEPTFNPVALPYVNTGATAAGGGNSKNVTSGGPPYCGVPLTCCKMTSANTCTHHHILKETHSAIEQIIQTEGCYDAIWNEFRHNYLIISSITLAVGFVLVISLLITHTSIKEIQISNQKQKKAKKQRLQVHQIYNDL